MTDVGTLAKPLIRADRMTALLPRWTMAIAQRLGGLGAASAIAPAVLMHLAVYANLV